MMKIISSEEVTRQEGSRRIDGLLYTSNAMLAIERKLVQVYNPVTDTWTNALSRSGGNLTINGAVVAPDALRDVIYADPALLEAVEKGPVQVQ